MSPTDEDRQVGPALAAASRAMLLAGVVFGALLLAYAFSRFRSITQSRALLWYAVALAIMTLSFLASRMRPSLRVGLLLLAGVSGLLLFGLEWAVERQGRATFVRRQEALARLTGVPFDRRSIPEVVRDLRASGTPAVPSIVPGVMLRYTRPDSDPRSAFTADFFPLAGISHRPTVHLCNEDGRHPVYHSDRFGFANPDSVWDQAADVVLIGDSFAHGYCVPPDSALAASLRARWPRTINLATGGGGPLAELGALSEFGLAAHPRLVIWQFFENDFADLAAEATQPVLARYLESADAQHLASRQREVDSLLLPWIDHLYEAGLEARGSGEHTLRELLTLGVLRSRLGDLRRRRVPAPAPVDQSPLFARVLGAARDRLAADSGRMLMVVVPSWEEFYAPGNRAGEPAAAIAVARRLGIPVIDLTEAFRAHADRPSLFGRRDLGTAHYSSAGYALVTGQIIRAVDSLGLSPLRPAQASGLRPSY